MDADALRALAAGSLADWHGVPDGITPADADAALAAGKPPPATQPGTLAGEAADFRRYPPTPFAPMGVIVWFEGGLVSIVEISDPEPAMPLEQQLGPPEAELESYLGTTRVQAVWASRGLAVHTSEITRAVYRVYAFSACTVDDWRADPLSRIEERRLRRS